jgi:predicted phage terminase large subunit-like protein
LNTLGAGCGKSHQALLKVLMYKDDPNFRGVFIRETNTQLTQSGGLWQEAQALWRQFGATFKQAPGLCATFPSGAMVQFKVMGADRDISNYDGGQYSLVIFDEAQNHTETQIRYLESRIRSRAKGPHQLVLTCNPKSNHEYLLKLVWPYLDPDTGCPRDEMFAKERYYGAYNGQIVVGATKEELEQQYPGITALTYTFVAANIYSNPRMRILNPAYISRLENLKRVERERLLLGSWTAKESSAGYFKREWVEMIDKAPRNTVARARGMDLASTLASESNPNPDWTATVRASKTKDGYYVIEHVERYRKLTNGVLEEIVKCDRKDKDEGFNIPVYIPKDPGASGAAAAQFFTRYLIENGVDARQEQMSGHSGKLARMQAFLSLAEAGLVKVVKADWNDFFFNELEDYVDGNRNQKDDCWDACGSCIRALLKNQTMPAFSLPINTQPSPIPSL